MSKKVTTTTALVDCLVDNNRFATRKINADQIGAENFRDWKDLIANLHKSAYTVYSQCENNDLSVDNPNLDFSKVFYSIRAILEELGEINGHKLTANAELATLIVGYSGKRANVDSPDLQLVNSKIRNRQRELAEYEKTNGVNPEAIENMNQEIADLVEERTELLDKPDNRIKAPTRTNFETFRLEVEHRLARVIADQKAKTWAELEAEAEAKRQERRAKTKAKKAAAKAEAQSK